MTTQTDSLRELPDLHMVFCQEPCRSKGLNLNVLKPKKINTFILNIEAITDDLSTEFPNLLKTDKRSEIELPLPVKNH
jgi:hypothetical protein